MATDKRSQGRLTPEEIETLVEEYSRKEKRWNEAKHRFELEKKNSKIERNKLLEQIQELQRKVAQLAQAQLKLNIMPSIEIPKSTADFSSPPQPNNIPLEIGNYQFFDPKEIIDLIPKFDGYNISVYDFTKPCQDASAKFFRYSVQDLIESFKLRLTGDAYRLFTRARFETVEDFIRAIKETFSKRTLNQYLRDLGDLRQRFNENMVQYACRTRKLERALLDVIKSEYPNGGNIVVKKLEQIEADVLKSFIDGTTHFIRRKLIHAENRNLIAAITNAITIEQKLIKSNPNLLYNENNNNHGLTHDTRYDGRRANTKYKNCDRNYNPNAKNKVFNRENGRNDNYINRQQNSQSRSFPEEKRNYYQQNHQNQRSGDYRDEHSRNYKNNKNYNTHQNHKSYPPPNNYETNRFNTQSNNFPTGTKVALISQPEPEKCKLRAKKTKKMRITILNPEVKVGILKRQELFPGVYFDRTVVRPKKGKAVIDIVNDTNTAVTIEVPTLAISPFEEFTQ
ncbi:hypothetical protein M0802_010209 [Mischocyttarus mexicanus]|nr:hypothetical protein M0802_010209 [Mischocyttarus mexicanus]